jgi:dipeptidyl-peptidase-4
MMHGTFDNNVHMQNTMEMADALIRADKQFDLMLYPNKEHSIYGGKTRLHVFTRITDFILQNL